MTEDGLLTAKELLTGGAYLMSEGAWCQGSLAHNLQGDSVGMEDPEAVSFCAIGALGAQGILAVRAACTGDMTPRRRGALHRRQRRAIKEAEDALLKVLHNQGGGWLFIASWSDSLGPEIVAEVMMQASELV